MMRKHVKTIICIIAAFSLLWLCPLAVMASDGALDSIHGVTLLREIPIPERLNLTITEDPPERLYFHQYFVSEDDWFLLNSRDMDRSTEEDASQVYIDIYDSNGVFQKTVRYTSSSDDGAELKGSTVIIYLTSYVIFVDLESDTITAYETETYAARNAGVEKLLNNKVQSSSQWEYRSKGLLNEKHTLIRSNETGEETLIALPGIGMSLFEHFVSLGFTAVMLFGFSHVKKRVRMKKEKAEPLSFTCERIE